MRPIPLKLRKQIAEDPFMKKCCYRDCKKTEVEWNHTLMYAGRQVNTWYAIVPLCTEHHRGNNGTIYNDVKEWCELITYMRGGAELDKDCPKMSWRQHKQYLTEKLCK